MSFISNEQLFEIEKKLSSDNDIFASIGPCIGKSSYEVDVKFYKKFLSNSPKNKKYFSEES